MAARAVAIPARPRNKARPAIRSATSTVAIQPGCARRARLYGDRWCVIPASPIAQHPPKNRLAVELNAPRVVLRPVPSNTCCGGNTHSPAPRAATGLPRHPTPRLRERAGAPKRLRRFRITQHHHGVARGRPKSLGPPHCGNDCCNAQQSCVQKSRLGPRPDAGGSPSIGAPLVWTA